MQYFSWIRSNKRIVLSVWDDPSLMMSDAKRKSSALLHMPNMPLIIWNTFSKTKCSRLILNFMFYRCSSSVIFCCHSLFNFTKIDVFFKIYLRKRYGRRPHRPYRCNSTVNLYILVLNETYYSMYWSNDALYPQFGFVDNEIFYS